MNYKKKYKEALKRAQKVHNEHKAQPFDVMLKVFPELKESESEDEKVRQEIIDFLKLPHPQFVGKRDHEKWIAWLEKQGNVDIKLIQYRKYLVSETEKWQKAGSDKTNSAIGKQDCTGHANAFISARSEFEKVFNWDDLLEKQGEQKHADNIEPKFKVGDWVVLNGNPNSTYQVEKIENYHYVLTHRLGGTIHIPFGSENSMSLWTKIQYK